MLYLVKTVTGDLGFTLKCDESKAKQSKAKQALKQSNFKAKQSKGDTPALERL